MYRKMSRKLVIIFIVVVFQMVQFIVNLKFFSDIHKDEDNQMIFVTCLSHQNINSMKAGALLCSLLYPYI